MYDWDKLADVRKFAYGKTEDNRNQYQQAVVENGLLEPVGSSAQKYDIICMACNMLGAGFSFGDFGCSHGLFGVLINQDFANVTGSLINQSKKEVEVCEKVLELLGIDNLDVVRSDMMAFARTYDLTIYMSLVHHLLRQGGAVEEISEKIRSQTKKIAVVEVPSETDDSLAKKVLGDNVNKLLTLRNCLSSKFTILKEVKLDYVRPSITRTVYFLKI